MAKLAQPVSGSVVPDEVLLVDFEDSAHGHRGQYNAMLGRLFRLRRASLSLATLLSRSPILCPQIEADPGRFVLACCLRSLIGRPTAGLLFRPLPALKGRTLRLRVKRACLKLLLRLPNTQVLTIVPFAVEPGFATIAHGWIHDLQNWDLQLDAEPVASPAARAVTRQVRAFARGRPVCCAIGRQVRDKGFDRFAAYYSASPALREAMLFAYGGLVDAELRPDAAGFAAAGGFALDRFVSDAELSGLYRASELIWCCYDPDYDQASGVLGRAMQHGIPVIARRGSVVARICASEGHPCIAIGDEDGWEKLADVPPRMEPRSAQARARGHGEISLSRLADALQSAPAWNPFAGPGE